MSMSNRVVKTVSWPGSSATSNAVSLDDLQWVGIEVPSGFTGTSITLTACTTIAGTYTTVKDVGGNMLTITVAASQTAMIPASLFDGLVNVKLVSSATEANTHTVNLILRPMAGA